MNLNQVTLPAADVGSAAFTAGAKLRFDSYGQRDLVSRPPAGLRDRLRAVVPEA